MINPYKTNKNPVFLVCKRHKSTKSKRINSRMKNDILRISLEDGISIL
jgi:hypothetical protein